MQVVVENAGNVKVGSCTVYLEMIARRAFAPGDTRFDVAGLEY